MRWQQRPLERVQIFILHIMQRSWRSILKKYKTDKERNNVKWTYISPAGDFQADGERSGKYILSGEELTLNSKSASIISYTDYAPAMVDEIEKGKHVQQKIGVVRE